ncbi:hypothetical protein [Halobacillus andaensis]|uniref:hypothetical protein n=1 Tax=Halobacillus andaensis TaxID=1176239 RepID=UPI003D70B154
MKRGIKVLLFVLGAIVLLIGGIIVVFIVSMTPEAEKEEKVTKQAEEYMSKHFDHEFEIYDTLYDNMGNFEFEYAAKVRDIEGEIDFLVYESGTTSSMTDTYASEKWTKQLEEELERDVRETFKDSHRFFVYLDPREGPKLSLEHPGRFEEAEIEPAIHIEVARERNDEDEELVNGFVDVMKERDLITDGKVFLDYIANGGEILDDSLIVEF